MDAALIRRVTSAHAWNCQMEKRVMIALSLQGVVRWDSPSPVDGHAISFRADS
jgi:hypothetical protein